MITALGNTAGTAATNWDTLNSTSPTQARLLDQNDLVRYRGDGKNGETADLTFRAWDQTGGTAGQTTDVTGQTGEPIHIQPTQPPPR